MSHPPRKSPAEIMREMRLMALTGTPREVGLKPSPEFPRVCGMVMDLSLDTGTVTLVTFSSGDASIYTTSTFGVFGGIGHKTVREAAQNSVRIADRYYDRSKPTENYEYPPTDRVRFYLVCYDGLRVIDADAIAVGKREGPFADLFDAAQKTITELRLIVQENGNHG